MPAPKSRLHFWLLPAAAAVGTLTLAVIGIVFLLRASDEKSDREDERKSNHAGNGSPEERIAQGRRLMKEGSFRLARETLRSLSPEADRNAELRQLFQETDILADLLKQPLEEILQQAQDVKPDEWTAQFTDYHLRSVLFDDTVLCEPGPNGRYRLVGYQVRLGEERARLDLDQHLFRQLQSAGRLQPGRPRRLVFGTRLAGVRQEKDVWVIQFENESTVLMTEEDALTACGLDVRDPELKRVLSEQREWLRRK